MDMNKEEILELIKNHNDTFVQIIKAKHRDFYDEINQKFEGIKFSEKLYRWINFETEKLGKCKWCGNKTKFLSIINGYREYCSPKCANISTIGVRSEKLTQKGKNLKYWVENCCEVCNKQFWSLKFRNQRFCSNKCSADIISKDKNRIAKIKKTKLEKYGNENYVNPNKAKLTSLEKYGVDNPSKSKEIKNKIIQTNLEKYGVEYSWQNEDVKNKIKQTNSMRYGVECITSSDIIKQKIKKTNLEKYGAENVFGSNEIKEKIKQTCLNKFGKEYFSETDDFKEKVKKNHLERFYKKLIKTHKLNNLSIPLFTKEEYKNTYRDNKYKFQCRKCGIVFYDHIDGGHLPRCLDCFPYIRGFSLHEKEVVDYIKSLLPNETILEDDRIILSGKELDIYIPSKKLAIEYNGLYWHSEMGGNKGEKYHLNKTTKCNELDIRLIQIFEDEWINKKEIIKSKLKHILGLNNENKIYARKCKVKLVENINNVMEFLDNNHLQGGIKSSKINIGLYFNDELVSLMSFGSPRISLGINKFKENEFTLTTIENFDVTKEKEIWTDSESVLINSTLEIS